MMSERLVLDANVFVSALINPDGTPGIILQEALKGDRYTLLLSPSIIEELQNILKYPKFKKYISFTENQLELWIDSLHMLSHSITPRFTYETLIPEDPDDDCYLITAIEGKANIIVSGDKHLLKLHPYQGINMLTPRQFLRMYIER